MANLTHLLGCPLWLRYITAGLLKLYQSSHFWPSSQKFNPISYNLGICYITIGFVKPIFALILCITAYRLTKIIIKSHLGFLQSFNPTNYYLGRGYITIGFVKPISAISLCIWSKISHKVFEIPPGIFSFQLLNSSSTTFFLSYRKVTDAYWNQHLFSEPTWSNPKSLISLIKYLRSRLGYLHFSYWTIPAIRLLSYCKVVNAYWMNQHFFTPSTWSNPESPIQIFKTRL